MENQTKKTWFITGTSQGIGLVLVKQLLELGHNVVATARNAENLKKAVASTSSNFLPLQVDLVSESSVKIAVTKAVDKFGTIDYLVNNAGYGVVGGIEELTDAEVRTNYDINVFGLLNVTRAILPIMREAKKGHIINFSSIFGLLSSAGWGIYCSTKFAVEGLSEALADEVKSFGAKVTIIEPGYVRTNFLNGSLVVPKEPIQAYTDIRQGIRTHQEEISGKQLGDPEKVAELVIKVGALENPPLRLLTGSDAYNMGVAKADQLKESMEQNKELSFSTDFKK